MAQAMTLISSQVLGSATASVTFSSIPGTYRDLRLIVTGTYTTGSGLAVAQFNGYTGSNYSFVQMYGTGSTTGSSSGTNTSFYLGDLSTTVAVATADVMDYSATDKHKTVLVRGSSSDQNVRAFANRWANTAAVTQIVVIPGSGNFATGTSFYLYGIVG
jgi:hypothetical protein